MPSARIGAIAFIHRFGSSLNAHVHFHCCVVDGVFQPAAKIGDTADVSDAVTSVDFHATTNLTNLDSAATARVQAQVRQRVLRAFAASHYLWAMLLARIYETLPLVCPLCQSPMRIIAFITEGSSVREILDHPGESSLPPKVASWCGCF